MNSFFKTIQYMNSLILMPPVTPGERFDLPGVTSIIHASIISRLYWIMGLGDCNIFSSWNAGWTGLEKKVLLQHWNVDKKLADNLVNWYITSLKWRIKDLWIKIDSNLNLQDNDPITQEHVKAILIEYINQGIVRYAEEKVRLDTWEETIIIWRFLYPNFPQVITKLNQITWHPNYIKDRIGNYITKYQYPYLIARKGVCGVPFPDTSFWEFVATQRFVQSIYPMIIHRLHSKSPDLIICWRTILEKWLFNVLCNTFVGDNILPSSEIGCHWIILQHSWGGKISRKNEQIGMDNILEKIESALSSQKLRHIFINANQVLFLSVLQHGFCHDKTFNLDKYLAQIVKLLKKADNCIEFFKRNITNDIGSEWQGKANCFVSSLEEKEKKIYQSILEYRYEEAWELLWELLFQEISWQFIPRIWKDLKISNNECDSIVMIINRLISRLSQ